MSCVISSSYKHDMDKWWCLSFNNGSTHLNFHGTWMGLWKCRFVLHSLLRYETRNQVSQFFSGQGRTKESIWALKELYCSPLPGTRSHFRSLLLLLQNDYKVIYSNLFFYIYWGPCKEPTMRKGVGFPKFSICRKLLVNRK